MAFKDKPFPLHYKFLCLHGIGTNSEIFQTQLGALAAVDDLADYVTENGPYDAVIGFSLGAALIATLLLHTGKDNAIQQIRSAVFICGTLPCCPKELAIGRIRLLQAKDATSVIKTPTLHLWSREDAEYPGQSEQLVQVCTKETRRVIMHGAGHNVPSRSNEAAEIAAAVVEVCSSSLTRGP
ncbi:serine hydrolase-domain-containing protein [Xylaria arbuscula]|nr:serine hydrolase-domain-containing protein [Xylaria arbuscula]